MYSFWTDQFFLRIFLTMAHNSKTYYKLTCYDAFSKNTKGKHINMKIKKTTLYIRFEDENSQIYEDETYWEYFFVGGVFKNILIIIACCRHFLVHLVKVSIHSKCVVQPCTCQGYQ